jgi:hypothetical protein
LHIGLAIFDELVGATVSVVDENKPRFGEERWASNV